jgi:TIR domain.
MSYLPGFEYDIFISYSHKDNEPILEEQRGWVDSFEQTLRVLLHQLLGAEVTIWRDKRQLRGNDYFDEEILAQLRRSALFLAIVSPGYLNSQWCRQELAEFCKVAEATNGLRLANRSRIFKVLKTDMPHERQPAAMQGLLGFSFFDKNPETGHPREFRADPASGGYQRFLDKLSDLAHEIRDLMEVIRAGAPMHPATDEAITVYLAETTFDQTLARDKIKRELQQRGYALLPDHPLPLAAPELINVVRANLAQANLTIHIIGEKYGLIPEDETRSIVCLQHELAAERAGDARFSRLIWMPEELTAKDERQRRFIDSLRLDAGGGAGVELLQTPLEEFKTFIEDRVNALRRPRREEDAGDAPKNGRAHIYLICDQQDVEAVVPIEDYLFNYGFETVLPAMDGDEAQVREDHKENLLLCDAALIYYGNTSELWLRAKLRDLQKAAGYGRRKPMRAKGIYIAGGETLPKQRFRTHEATVIKHFGAFSADSLRPFIAQLEAGKGGQKYGRA